MTVDEHVLALTRAVIHRLERPNEDVPPILVVYTQPDCYDVLPTEYRSEAEKLAYFTFIIPAAIKAVRAVAIAHVSMGWGVDHKEPPGGFERDTLGRIVNKWVPVHKDPERKECLAVNVVTASAVKTYIATVTRTPDTPPIFGELTPMGTTEAYLLQHCQKALRELAGPG